MPLLGAPPLNTGFLSTGSSTERRNFFFPASLITMKKLNPSARFGGGSIPQRSFLLNRYCKMNDPIEAEKLLHRMVETGFDPDFATFQKTVSSFCENGRVNDAFHVFDAMRSRGYEPTISVYNCLLKGLCYVGKVENAKELMRSIAKSNLRPDICTYNAMMNGLCKVGRTIEALELLDEALEMGLWPNAATFNTLLNGYFKQGRPMLGFGVLRRMATAKCKPDHITYSTMIHGLLKCGKAQPAHQVYQEMIGDGFPLDERLMNSLMRGLCRTSRQQKELLKDVYCLLDEMKASGYPIYPCAYNLLVEAFWRGREMDSVFGTLMEMIEMGYSPKTFTFNITIHGLCSVGQVDKALTVLMLMHPQRKARGIPFNALINELNVQGRSLEASIVHGMALKRGVVPKRQPLSKMLQR